MLTTSQASGAKLRLMLDPYALLEVARDATPDEIKRAFRRLAKELHPDVNPNSPASARRFKEITQAYDVLSDAAKRRACDAELALRQRERTEQTAKPNRPNQSGARPGGTKPGRDQAADAFLRGSDLHYTLNVSFIEAALGTSKRVALGGDRTVDIVIPPLTTDGQVLRVRGQGSAGMFGGPSGDLLVDILIDAHALFTRKGNDIHMALPVTIPEAVLGATVVVQTVHGAVQIKIPPGSNTDTLLRLKGMGLPQSQAGQANGAARGDQYVTLKVVMPPPEDDEFPKLVDVWSKRKPYRVRPI